jgi:hypothetical protein
VHLDHNTEATFASPSAALEAFGTAQGYRGNWTWLKKGPVFFGYNSTKLQCLLREKLAGQRSVKKAKQARHVKQDIKQTVENVKKGKEAAIEAASAAQGGGGLDLAAVFDAVAEAKDNGHIVPDEEGAAMFGYHAGQKVVKAMLKTIESCLIVGRDPEQRLHVVLERFLNHPTIKLALGACMEVDWRWDVKKQAVVDNLIYNVRAEIKLLKGKRTLQERGYYQSLLRLITSEKKGLVRATAAMFGLSSRRGLLAARHDLVAAAQVEDEADEEHENRRQGLFVPGQKRQNKPDTVHEAAVEAASEWWLSETRLTANARNVVTKSRRGSRRTEKGKAHPVHWLEHSEDEFFERFLESSGRRYNDQILLRGATGQKLDSSAVRMSLKAQGVAGTFTVVAGKVCFLLR